VADKPSEQGVGLVSFFFLEVFQKHVNRDIGYINWTRYLLRNLLKYILHRINCLVALFLPVLHRTSKVRNAIMI
jgi:hypothetical protein